MALNLNPWPSIDRMRIIASHTILIAIHEGQVSNCEIMFAIPCLHGDFAEYLYE